MNVSNSIPWREAFPDIRDEEGKKWCRGTESNCRHGDFQSPALPTELPRRAKGMKGFFVRTPRRLSRLAGQAD
jgi:hypothetical protein